MALSRRKFLMGATAISGAWVTWGSQAAWGVAASVPAASAHSPLAPQQLSAFMQLSQLLVNHRLNAGIGARMAAFAATQYPDCASMMTQIIALAASKKATAVEDFFADIPEGPLQDFAHWVILAWYSGSSSPKKDAQLFTFEEALTYKLSADAVAIPSYGFSGPNMWSRPIVPLTPMPSF